MNNNTYIKVSKLKSISKRSDNAELVDISTEVKLLITDESHNLVLHAGASGPVAAKLHA